MAEVLSLALPFFGLIFLGYGSGKLVRLPDVGLAWLQFFVVYLALPALFFQMLSQTPIEELANWRFVVATTTATAAAFTIAFGIGMLASRGRIPEATIQGIVGGYANVGYMGPGLTLAALGPTATVPAALIFCFDSMLLFTLVPVLMAIGGNEGGGVWATVKVCLKRIFTHPFILATIAGVAAAALELRPPQALEQLLTYLRSAAAPCALFAMGVTAALRPVPGVPWELPFLLLVKLVLHPAMVFALMLLIGGFSTSWIETAVLMASLPPAANSFVLASQYRVYVERASGAVLFGTAASVLTVTLTLYLITEDLLPLLD